MSLLPIVNTGGAPDSAQQWSTKTNANFNYLLGLIQANSEVSPAAPPIENPYNNLADMIADQSNQTSGFFQFVQDARTTQEVSDGVTIYKAYFEYLGTVGNSIVDYRKLSDHEAQQLVTTPFNHLTVKQIETTQILETDPFTTVSFMYDAVTGKIQSAIFNPVFTKYLTRYMDLLPDTTLTLQFWNTSKNLGLAATITNFEFTEYIGTSLFLKADLVNTIDQADIKVGDILVTDISVGGVGDVTVDAAMSNTSTNPVQNKVAKAYADTKWAKGLIEVDRYNNIPFVPGYYVITKFVGPEEGDDEYQLELQTNVYRFEDDSAIPSTLFLNFDSTEKYCVVKREYISALTDFEDDNALNPILLDTIYSANGDRLGVIYPQGGGNTIIVDDNIFLQSVFSESVYKKTKTKTDNYQLIISTKKTASNYNNGLFTSDFSFSDNIKIHKAEVLLNNKKIDNCKIGLIESDTENKLGVLDYSGDFENDIAESQLTIILDYSETTASNATKRITPFLNNTQTNVVNLETNTTHSNAMVLTFNEVYGTFPNTIFKASSTNILDFLSDSYKTEIADNNVDFMFSAGPERDFLKSNSLKDAYGVIPCGSNDLVRIDLTDAVDKFPSNYISVTSRSETDNTGTDPLGTSYGFGTEFNEPTRTADLTGQGLTDWGGSSEHQQSPATAIVAAKLKYIKDQTGATWDIVREAARRSASNYGSYNIYRGFGVIDTATAIAQVPTVQKERSLVLAEYWKHATPFNQNLLFEDKSAFTPLVKRDLNSIPFGTAIEFSLSGGNSATTNWWLINTTVGDIDARNLYNSVSGLTPSNDFLNVNPNMLSRIVANKCRIKSVSVQGRSNIGSGIVDIVVLASKATTFPVGTTLENNKIVARANINLSTYSGGFFKKRFTSNEITSNVIQEFSELRVLFNNNGQACNFLVASVLVEFENVI